MIIFSLVFDFIFFYKFNSMSEILESQVLYIDKDLYYLPTPSPTLPGPHIVSLPFGIYYFNSVTPPLLHFYHFLFQNCYLRYFNSVTFISKLLPFWVKCDILSDARGLILRGFTPQTGYRSIFEKRLKIGPFSKVIFSRMHRLNGLICI